MPPSTCTPLPPTESLPYQLLLEDHVSEPIEVLRLEGREDKDGVLLVALWFLDGSLGISDAHGGLGANVLLIAAHWGLIQSVEMNHRHEKARHTHMHLLPLRMGCVCVCVCVCV